MDRSVITKHLRNVFKAGELSEDSVCAKFAHTAADGKTYRTNYYNLDALIAVGYRVDRYQATQFRIWATKTLREFIIKGFVLDDERLKQGKQVFGRDYFDELLERIREIRASERRFYQKITDIYALSADYSADAPLTKEFFAAAGLEDARLDIFSAEFLSRVAALEQKNLALETLRKLLTDQIRITERCNLVQSKKFREALDDAMVRCRNKAFTTAEMLARLLDLARWVREVQNRGEERGLNPEETAFYDAIAENESARQAMENDKLRLMARELAEMVKKLPKLDWAQRESVPADLRRQVRRLLARFGYPPDLSEDATNLVLRQAEFSTANGE